MLLLCLICSILLLVSYQDYKYRAVSWYLFPALAGLFLMNHNGLWDQALPYFLINLSFVLINLLMLTCLFSLKNHKFANITKDYLGWGDILFLVVMAFVFSPLNYLVFFMVSLISVCILVFFAPQLKQSIPLAGIQSVLLLAVLIGGKIFRFDLFSDDWFLML